MSPPGGDPPAGTELVMVANRLPVSRRTDADGSESWVRSPGGLVAAVWPTLLERGGAWIGWAGDPGTAPDPFEIDGISLVPVRLEAGEVEEYYEGFSNGTLWPLYHDLIRPPQFHREWWQAYTEVNERFAEVVADSAAPNASVWIHDYHLQLVPMLLRARRPDLRIGFFLHIPFPPQELFMQLPWRRRLVEGLLGADVVGFQVPVAAQNFAGLARRLAGATGSLPMLRVGDRLVHVGAFPISIDVAHFERLAATDEVVEMSRSLRLRLGDPRHVLLGVDRLDYTKGIDVRLKAFRELLASGVVTTEDATLVQIAVPSRENVEEYDVERERIERLVGEINGTYARLGVPAVQYLHQSLSPTELVAAYRTADIMLVTPYRDGMNLVAKEYVASRLDDTGTLVLSEFTGAAKELTQAVLVNPHDITGVKDAIVRSLDPEASGTRRRMRALRRVVRNWTVHDWADSFLAAMAGEFPPRDKSR